MAVDFALQLAFETSAFEQLFRVLRANVAFQ
jgi:hypothetical protein